MKRKSLLFVLAILLILSLACSLGGTGDSEEENTTPLQSEHRCGDGVCDGPENSQNCLEDCSVNAEGEKSEEEEASTASLESKEISYGYVYSSISLDRDAGTGDCGIDPWYTSECSAVRIWWDMHMTAFASTPVLIIPDGENRWVITNNADVASKSGKSLSGGGGEYQSIALNPEVTNPECGGSVEGRDFDFQVMGTRENGLTELILSANPVEHSSGSCMSTPYEWNTSFLLYGWSVALSNDPNDLSFQLNDTFREQAGQYTFKNEINTNPSPENRDHVKVELGFLCTASASNNISAPIPCPWEK